MKPGPFIETILCVQYYTVYTHIPTAVVKRGRKGGRADDKRKLRKKGHGEPDMAFADYCPLPRPPLNPPPPPRAPPRLNPPPLLENPPVERLDQLVRIGSQPSRFTSVASTTSRSAL